jgi:hypothetical protein
MYRISYLTRFRDWESWGKKKEKEKKEKKNQHRFPQPLLLTLTTKPYTSFHSILLKVWTENRILLDISYYFISIQIKAYSEIA